MKSFMAKKETVERKWLVVDATDQIVGRLATKLATILRGKNKPEYTPHCDVGDFVVVLNAEKVRFTGKKLKDKKYHYHTGYPGGIKTLTPNQILNGKFPDRVLRMAVKGMLPKNVLGRAMLRKLKIYKGSEHRHHAQGPETLAL